MENQMTKQCIKCKVTQPAKEFYAENITGVSKYCITCRKKRQRKIEKKVQRTANIIKEKASIEQVKLIQKELALKINQLQKEFNRFTLDNRNRLQVLLKKCESRAELSDRTIKAIEGRRLSQSKAEALLAYQIDVVTAGLQTQNITLLWRDRYGNDPGSHDII
jgi:hypothetical protein